MLLSRSGVDVLLGYVVSLALYSFPDGALLVMETGSGREGSSLLPVLESGALFVATSPPSPLFACL